MNVQSVNNQRNCSKNPSFEAVEVRFLDNEVKPIARMLRRRSCDKVVLQGNGKKFNPSEYMKNFAQRFSKFLEEKGIVDGKIEIARAYGPGVKENTLNASYELGNKHIEGPSSFLAADLLKGEDSMNFKPIITTFNDNAPHTMVRHFSSTENPFRVFNTKTAFNNNKSIVTHQEYASHMSVGKFETGFFERFK